MSDKLEHIFQLQREFGKKFTNFGNLSEMEKQKAVIDFIGHCQEELIELKQEIPSRKHWSKRNSRPMDQRKMLLEFVDIIHFLVTIALIMEWDANDVYQMYLHKNKVNHDRQANPKY